MLARITRIVHRYITRNSRTARKDNTWTGKPQPRRYGWVETVDRFGLMRLEWQTVA